MRVYRLFTVLLSAVVLSWFLPWLYSLVFPVGVSYPFVGYSPVSDSFVVTDNTLDDRTAIFSVDSCGRVIDRDITRSERDSLLPQIYFTQLSAQGKLPDTINGKAVSIPVFKHNQWVYNSLPRDINRCGADVHLMMESMPVRFELEDPKVVFRMNDDRVKFVDIATNSVDVNKSHRFTDLFRERGFEYPACSMSADITSRKPYDEGYLMADARGRVFHVKMQAGRPYMVEIPGLTNAEHVFILENPDRRHIGFVVDSVNYMYVVEREGYVVKPLPVGKVNPRTDKVIVMANVFNWVVRTENADSAVWTAIDADDYTLLGRYAVKRPVAVSETVASYIFPYELSFTAITDCYARPRIDHVSWKVIYFNVLLAMIVMAVNRRRGRWCSLAPVLTLVMGIYVFVPMLLIRE